MTLHRFKFSGLVLMVMLFASVACGNGVNKSLTVPDGTASNGESTVNGSISVGKNATVTGSVETVNGTVRIGENTRVEDAETVNGSIHIESGASVDDVSSVNGSILLSENVTVDGEVSVVNGKISLGSGTMVAADVSNVNGTISIVGTEINGDLSTTNGDVTLADGSTLYGNLIVEKPGGWGWRNKNRKPTIIIGPNTTVVGNIDLEREVELFISATADVGGVKGVMSMADAVRFSGERP